MHFPWLISLNQPDRGISRISWIYSQELSDTKGTGDSAGESCDTKIKALSNGSKQGGCGPGCGCSAHSGSREFPGALLTPAPLPSSILLLNGRGSRQEVLQGAQLRFVRYRPVIHTAGSLLLLITILHPGDRGSPRTVSLRVLLLFHFNLASYPNWGQSGEEEGEAERNRRACLCCQ